MSWRANYDPRVLLVVVVVATFAGAWALTSTFDLPNQDEFNVLEWEFQHVAGKWLYLAERVWSAKLSPEEEDERLARMLAITSEISRLRGDDRQADRIEQLRRERDAIENDVEAIIEGRVTSVLEDAGLESSLPLLSWPSLIWPPVDFEFDQPLPVLSVSPRDRIERIEGRPLRLGMTLDEAVAFEERVEANGEVSAIVDAVGGVATYPSIVAYDGDYEALVQTVAHEWMHHYLFFKPLGRRYYESPDLRTLNETVANMAAEEIAALVVERYPLASSPAPDTAEQEVLGDYADAVLRRLRLDVERLLDAGRTSDAETLMETRRLELSEAGIRYRRINQAFFAARSFYADTGASINPIGPRLLELREQSASLRDFIDTVSQFTSASDLERTLAQAD